LEVGRGKTPAVIVTREPRPCGPRQRAGKEATGESGWGTMPHRTASPTGSRKRLRRTVCSTCGRRIVSLPEILELAGETFIAVTQVLAVNTSERAETYDIWRETEDRRALLARNLAVACAHACELLRAANCAILKRDCGAPWDWWWSQIDPVARTVPPKGSPKRRALDSTRFWTLAAQSAAITQAWHERGCPSSSDVLGEAVVDCLIRWNLSKSHRVRSRLKIPGEGAARIAAKYSRATIMTKHRMELINEARRKRRTRKREADP
jgi:antitoxin (DNA-binding transcriptional repressor) of toxin-antitoxin stability system